MDLIVKSEMITNMNKHKYSSQSAKGVVTYCTSMDSVTVVHCLRPVGCHNHIGISPNDDLVLCHHGFW